VSEPESTVRYSYNRAGNQTREDITTDGVTLSTRNEYNLQGRQTATVYPDNRRLDYTLDRGGVTSAIPGVLFHVEYDADGTVLGYLLANGVAVSSPRDPVSRRLSEVAARRGAATLRRLAYDYDAVGNITAIRDEIGADVQFQSYTYDGLHRLAGYSVHRDNAAGPVLRAGAYAYDGRGHTQSFGDLAALDFDPLDRLARIVKANGVELRMLYDARNRAASASRSSRTASSPPCATPPACLSATRTAPSATSSSPTPSWPAKPFPTPPPPQRSIT
jgi:YD repeat-containing protein